MTESELARTVGLLRAFDELICEVILRWRRPTRAAEGEPWYVPIGDEAELPVSAFSVPHFTTRMESAWKLAEHLRGCELLPGRRRDFELYQQDRVDHGLWVCETQATPCELYRNGQPVRVCHRRPELAICFAALEAFRIPVPDEFERMRV